MSRQAAARAARLTPPAPGAIAVIRIDGPRAAEILTAILRQRTADRPPSLPAGRPVVCRLVDENTIVDDVVAVRLAGEDTPTFELDTHGGVRIVERTLQLLERHGATVVPADRMLAAGNTGDDLRRQADRALLGVTSRRLTRWLLAQRRLLPPYLARRESWTPDEAAAFAERSRVACRLIEGLHVAIVGPPNAGKSTLANRLIGRDRVIASDTPGTTRDWVSETALVRGWPVTLTDTAGIRTTDCAIEAEAIRRGRDKARAADLVVVVLDATLPRARLESGIHSATQGLTGVQPVIVALNKIDLMTPSGAVDGSECGPEAPGDKYTQCRISAKSGDGIEALEAGIETRLGLVLLGDPQPTAFLTAHTQGPFDLT